MIRDAGAMPGVTLNPATPLVMIEEVLPLVGLVLVMSINPGFGGQHYLPASTARIARLAEMRAERGLDYHHRSGRRHQSDDDPRRLPRRAAI